MGVQEVKPRAMIAEFIGTFGFAFAILASFNYATSGAPTPVIAAITLGVLVLTIGMVSGAHVNPAVTLGAYSVKKINLSNTLSYILAQFSGAMLAWMVMKIFMGEDIVTAGSADNSWLIFSAEALGTMFFTFGIAASMHHKYDNLVAAFAVGVSFFVGISMASIASNGILNPAVAAALESFSWSYILGPIVGGILGMQLYRVALTKKSKI